MTAAPESAELRFGDYRLPGPRGPLEKNGKPLKLQPKALAVLWTLARQPGEVVTKKALLDAVWPGLVVGDEALTFQVQALRKVLEDDARHPRLIVTVHRIGFRFVMPESGPARVTPETDRAALFVGRAAELHALQAAYARAAAGQRQIVFLTGEAGIGKTRLLETFLSSLPTGKSGPRLALGRCHEQSGDGEPYLPMLEAIGRLLRNADSEQPIKQLRTAAPSWLRQLPELTTAADAQELRRQTAGMRRDRMLREMADALDLLGRERPLVLALEDLHWCDGATLELLGMVARRREPARLLIVATSRAIEAILANHPSKTLRQTLSARGLAQERMLGYLDADETRRYLEWHLGSLEARAASLIHERSAGQPLFLTQITAYLADRGVDAKTLRALPQGLRDLIDLQLSELPLGDQLALEAAGVVGHEFSTAAAAAAAGLATEALEPLCERLVREGRFIEDCGLLAIWPDGTSSGRFRFRHVLYEQALRERIARSRKARLHRAVAERLESAYGARVHEVAGDLAHHFEQAGVAAKTARYCALLARQALDRAAADEALGQAQRGLALLDTQAASPERNTLEYALRAVAAAALQLQQGYASAGALPHLQRLQSLIGEVQDPGLLEAGLQMLWLSHHFRFLLDDALEYARRTQDLGRRLGKPALECAGCAWAAVSLQLDGQPRAAEVSSARATQLAQTAIKAGEPPPEPGCAALSARALARWIQGFPDQAMKTAADAVACTQGLGNPYAECITRAGIYNNLRRYRREYARVLREVEEHIALCRKYGHTEALGWLLKTRAIALCHTGAAAQGLPELRQGIAAQLATGSLMNLVADRTDEGFICLSLGRPDEARETVETLFEMLQGPCARSMTCEIWRLEGRLLLAEKEPLKGEERLRKAIEVAQEHQALILELRAATDLARLWRKRRQATAALDLLQPLYARFTEGFDTLDLKEAKQLLEELKR